MKAPGLVVLALALVDCSGAEPSCPNDLPTACVGAPSYADQIAPLIEAHCASCHSVGGQAAERPLVTYSEVYSTRSAVLTQVYGCRMPPAGSPAFTTAQRAAVLEWLVCGAPGP